jgi:hypothetical protein
VDQAAAAEIELLLAEVQLHLQVKETEVAIVSAVVLAI